jgi:hypothetical protein
LLTKIVDHPQKKVCHVWLGAGNKEELRKMQWSVTEWARSIGCVGGTITGRRGWERELLEDGWEFSAVELYKDLTKEVAHG